MRRRSFAAGAALTLSLALLAGCGSNDNAVEAGAGAAAPQQQIQPGGQRQQGGGQGMMNRAMADLIGKVKSVEGSTLTVYTSSFQFGAGGQGGMPGIPSGDGAPPADGQFPGGLEPPQDGQFPEGVEPPQDGQFPEGGQPGGFRGGMNFENMFSEETTDITITDATKIVKTEFVDGQMIETTLTIVDLKADDIVSIDLSDGTQEAATITLGMGGFGMGGGGGGFGGGGGRGMGGGNPPTQNQVQARQ